MAFATFFNGLKYVFIPVIPAFLASFTRPSSSLKFSTPFIRRKFTLFKAFGSFNSLFERELNLYLTNLQSQKISEFSTLSL